ncbi:MAG TPA: hypothetical protein VN920_12415, partial [Pyrinomonadaceae bacterium]|nr:hypothetical protein [Pyrinomonadaceae bacterium]
GNLMSPGNNFTKRELIIEVWEQLDCESVGAKELAEIQRSVRDRFGAGAVDSPASIARLLAGEGAVLRHPEVIDCDAEWREGGFLESLLPGTANFDSLEQAATAIKELDQMRQDLEAESRQTNLIRLREAVQDIRKDRLLVARSKVVDERTRSEANETAEWLSVWLNSPDLLSDWLELRRRSPEFRRLFSEDKLESAD